MVSITPLSRFSRRHPILSLALTLVGLGLLAGFALLTGTPLLGESHTLDRVGVSNTDLEPHRVEVEVHRGSPTGELLVARTLTVPAMEVPEDNDGDGVATGTGVAGYAAVTEGWSGAGEYAVRARLEGRSEWATLDLGRVDRQNDGWLSGRYPEPTECYTVLVRLSAGEPAGVDPVTLECGV